MQDTYLALLPKEVLLGVILNTVDYDQLVSYYFELPLAKELLNDPSVLHQLMEEVREKRMPIDDEPDGENAEDHVSDFESFEEWYTTYFWTTASYGKIDDDLYIEGVIQADDVQEFESLVESKSFDFYPDAMIIKYWAVDIAKVLDRQETMVSPFVAAAMSEDLEHVKSTYERYLVTIEGTDPGVDWDFLAACLLARETENEEITGYVLELLDASGHEIDMQRTFALLDEITHQTRVIDGVDDLVQLMKPTEWKTRVLSQILPRSRGNAYEYVQKMIEYGLLAWLVRQGVIQDTDFDKRPIPSYVPKAELLFYVTTCLVDGRTVTCTTNKVIEDTIAEATSNVDAMFSGYI